MRRRISIRGCVRPSVGPSVPRYFRRWKVRLLGASCAVYPALISFMIKTQTLHCIFFSVSSSASSPYSFSFFSSCYFLRHTYERTGWLTKPLFAALDLLTFGSLSMNRPWWSLRFIFFNEACHFFLCEAYNCRPICVHMDFDFHFFFQVLTVPEDAASNCVFANGTLLHRPPHEFPISAKVIEDRMSAHR